MRWRSFVLCVVLAAGPAPGCNCGGAAGGPDALVPDSAPPVIPAIWINEVVVMPRHDWSDGGGTPYDATPGNGPISSQDQFVELINAGERTLDLTGWTIELIDSDPSTTTLGVENVVLSEGATLRAFAPGDLLVIGDPAGFASTDVHVVLRDDDGQLVDDVEIGGLTEARDYEGDGIGDGAPAPDANGFARGAFDEAIARPAGAFDTDDDQDDFVKQPATPLTPNEAPEPPDEDVPPQVVARSTGNTWRVLEPLRIQLDEPVDAETVDPALELRRGSGATIGLGFTTFSDDDRVIVINPVGVLPFDADVEVTLRGGDGGVTDLAGNPLAADLVFTVHTEAPPADPAEVRINEICADPQQDWSDDHGGDGAAFSATPGDGDIDPSDEWVELLVLRPGLSDLSGYTLGMYRGTSLIDDARAVTPLMSTSSVIRVFGAGVSVTAVAEGDRVVIGNPASTMPSDFWLELRDAAGALVDVVEVGGNTSDSERGGDAIDDGAPGPGQDGDADGVEDECVARVPDGADTGADGDDFDRAAATLGAAN